MPYIHWMLLSKGKSVFPFFLAKAVNFAAPPHGRKT